VLIDAHDIYTIRLDQFEGPLDLLLHLIERAELDITTIALAHVADQYLRYVRAMTDRNAGQMSSFVFVASRLLVMKSRAILPQTPTSVIEPDESVDLVRQLREYQQFKEAAAFLRVRDQMGLQHFAKAPSLPNTSVASMPLRMTLDDLLGVWQMRMKLVDAPAPTIPLPAPKILTVGDVVTSIRERFLRMPRFSFLELLPRSQPTRVDVVVSLWAVLEMIKRRVIVAHQDDIFGPITIEQAAEIPTTLQIED
jgi:segregation and condensation protein A